MVMVMSEMELVGSAGVADPVAMGQVLRQMRLDAGLTQVELGRRVGIASAVICRYEAGRCGVSLRRLEEWAKACGCRLSIEVERVASDSSEV